MTKNEYWLFLENVRRSGAINMFGAAPLLEDAFDLSKSEARKVLMDWMSNYNPDDYEED